jgi:hypothetical protein
MSSGDVVVVVVVVAVVVVVVVVVMCICVAVHLVAGLALPGQDIPLLEIHDIHGLMHRASCDIVPSVCCVL